MNAVSFEKVSRAFLEFRMELRHVVKRREANVTDQNLAREPRGTALHISHYTPPSLFMSKSTKVEITCPNGKR